MRPSHQIVVVLSGSMEPGYYRGDILFLREPVTPVSVGDVVVFNTGDSDIPIVHRVIKLHEATDATILPEAPKETSRLPSARPTPELASIAAVPSHPHAHSYPPVVMLTKGDNNWGDDRELYPRGWEWLRFEHIVGRVFAYVPHAGRLTILLNDYPALKFGLIGTLALFVLTSKE